VRQADVIAIARSLYEGERWGAWLRQTYRPYICPFDIVVAAVPQNSRVFDVGCGEGLFLGLLAKAERISYGLGVDVSASSIAGAEAMAGRADLTQQVQFCHVSGEVDWPTELFDAVTIVDVLHHIPGARKVDFLKECAKRVRPGGVLIYKDISPYPAWKAAANRVHDLVLAREWINYLKAGAIINQMGDDGFALIRDERCDMLWYPHQLLVFQRASAECR